MATIEGRPKVELVASLQLDEGELRALDALVGYGDDAFVKAFYSQLGRHYMEPHEASLRRLFKSLRDQLPGILGRADDARAVFDGTKKAVRPPPPASPLVRVQDNTEGRTEVDPAREPGFGFQLSAEAKADIDELTRPPSAATIAAISNQIIGASGGEANCPDEASLTEKPK